MILVPFTWQGYVGMYRPGVLSTCTKGECPRVHLPILQSAGVGGPLHEPSHWGCSDFVISEILVVVNGNRKSKTKSKSNGAGKVMAILVKSTRPSAGSNRNSISVAVFEIIDAFVCALCSKNLPIVGAYAGTRF